MYVVDFAQVATRTSWIYLMTSCPSLTLWECGRRCLYQKFHEVVHTALSNRVGLQMSFQNQAPKRHRLAKVTRPLL